MDPRLRGGDEYLKLPIDLRNVTLAGSTDNKKTLSVSPVGQAANFSMPERSQSSKRIVPSRGLLPGVRL